MPLATTLLLLLSFSVIGAPPEKPPEPPQDPKPAPVLCKLLTAEAPRGGRLEVEGKGFGQTPLVRIAGKVARIIERRNDQISALIPRDSNGGMVTVSAGKHVAECGVLTIIGRDRD